MYAATTNLAQCLHQHTGYPECPAAASERAQRKAQAAGGRQTACLACQADPAGSLHKCLAAHPWDPPLPVLEPPADTHSHHHHKGNHIVFTC